LALWQASASARTFSTLVSPNIGSFHMYQYEPTVCCGSVCSIAGDQPCAIRYATCFFTCSGDIGGR